MKNLLGEEYITLEELLACILLEEGFVGNWTGKIINHQLENWFNLFLIIASIVTQGSILCHISISQ